MRKRDNQKIPFLIMLLVLFLAAECKKKTGEANKRSDLDSGDPAFTSDYRVALANVHMNFQAYNRAAAELRLAVEAEDDLIRKSDHMQKLAEALKLAGKTEDEKRVIGELIELFEGKVSEAMGTGAEPYFMEKIVETYFKLGNKDLAMKWAARIFEIAEKSSFDIARFNDMIIRYAGSEDSAMELLKDMVKEVEDRGLKERIIIQITNSYTEKRINYDAARKFLLEFIADEGNSEFASTIEGLMKQIDAAESAMASIKSLEESKKPKNPWEIPSSEANKIPPPPPFGYLQPNTEETAPVASGGIQHPPPGSTNRLLEQEPDPKKEEDFSGAGTPLPAP